MGLSLRIACALALIALWSGAVHADTSVVRDLPPGLNVPADAASGPGFDVDRATDAWLAVLSPEQRALSAACFEGGYWLQLFSTILLKEDP